MNRLVKYTLLTSTLVGFFIGFATNVFADPNGNNPSTLPNPLGQGCNSLSCPTTKVINFLFTIAVPLCAIMVLVGGFQMITAAGNPEKFGQGKKTILYAVIGFVIVLISGSVAALIQSFFGSS